MTPSNGRQGGDAPDSTPPLPQPDADGYHPQLSVVAGGAFYRLLIRGHLLRPPLHGTLRRIAAAVLITWAPLVVLSLIQHHSSSAVPFFTDLEVNVRLLISLPILIAADLVVHARLGSHAQQFLSRGIVLPENTEDFYEAARRARRLRDAVLTEVILLLVVILLGRWSWREGAAMSRISWYVVADGDHVRTSLAGYWYTFVSLPIYQFILLRWYVRLFIWFQFLWRVARLPLRLLPAHPDRAAGLSFIGQAALAFSPVLFAQGAHLSAIIANRIFHDGRTLPQFAILIAVSVLTVLVSSLAPLLMFMPLLSKAKRAGRLEYGRLASSYVQDFENKWINTPSPPSEPLLGSADIQSLADMVNSYSAVDAMKPFPFTTDVPIKLTLATIAPMLPLALTVVSLTQLLQFIAKIFL